MAIIVVGAVAIMFRRASSTADRWWALGLVVVASVLPLADLLWPEWAGVFQRGMFLLTYSWLFRELQPSPPASSGPLNAESEADG